MSGGVDSAVAAARCVAAGHEVIGISLRLARDGGPLLLARRLPRRAARRERLGFPHYVFDEADAFSAPRRRAVRLPSTSPGGRPIPARSATST
jgi:tRNA-specific 2-thiouridylase